MSVLQSAYNELALTNSRLRAERDDYKGVAHDLAKVCEIKDADLDRLRGECNECAVTISDLRAEVERLRATLQAIARTCAYSDEMCDALDIARRELGISGQPPQDDPEYLHPVLPKDEA